MDIKRYDFDYRIAEVMPMLEEKQLYGTKALIRDLKTVVDEIQEIRAKTIDEFAEQLKERLKGMQMVELQGEDVCPCRETGEDCPYMNQDIGCQYCAREQTIKDVYKIAEEMKGGATYGRTGNN